MDYTYAAYNQLLKGIYESGYQVITVRDYMEGIREPYTLILRHDVEWNPLRALAIAEMEKSYGFRSTFYFRANTKAFDLSIMKKLQNWGFEIGYHFDTLDRCRGDFEKAIEIFEKELKKFRENGINVETVCSHGNPRVKKIGYKVNNEIFLKDPDLRKRNGLVGEAYLDIDFSSLEYISDAGIRWNNVVSTNELVRIIKSKKWPIIYLLTHPDYWSKTALRSVILQLSAKAIRRFNIIKIIREIRELFTMKCF